MAMQRYVSDELTHFVGRGKPEAEQYRDLLQILREGVLARPPYDPARGLVLTVDYSASMCRNEVFSPEVVCFCDIPPSDFKLHMNKYSRFGLAFQKHFLVAKGATPVFYVAKNSTVPPDQSRCGYLDDMAREYNELFGLFERYLMDTRNMDLHRRATALRRFFDFGVFSFMKVFDDSLPEEDPDNFYMEREWRLLGGVSFRPEDVERVVIPREYGRRLRDDVPSYVGQVHFVR